MIMPTPKTDPTDIGANRTGIKTSPVQAQKMVEAAAAATPSASAGASGLASVRIEESRTSEPVGTVPPPASLKGAAKAVVKAVKGEKMAVFLDLIGERLAFERSGVRLYDALLAKFAAADAHPGGPTLQDLEIIRADELSHFHLLVSACEELGGDPTAMTPAADIIANASSGLLKVVSDPHTTFNQALKVALAAELIDNDSWALLHQLATQLELADVAARFEAAGEAEEEHLFRVRGWVERSVAGEAGVELPSAQPSPVPPG
jgi:rubrerythrin